MSNLLEFHLVERKDRIPDEGKNLVYLRIDHWNDYSFVTMFDVILFDENGQKHAAGAVKIGFSGQDITSDTYKTLKSPFTQLPENYFSVGQDVDYYSTLFNKLSESVRNSYLNQTNDIANDPSKLDLAKDEDVYKTSLLRAVSSSVIKEQYRRILKGGAPITDFEFSFKRQPKEGMGGIFLDFKVKANSYPSTNIHALIGRNGVGKTTIFNQMIKSTALGEDGEKHFFYITDPVFGTRGPIKEGFFYRLISVSFSAFDPFVPSKDNEFRRYIGLKNSDGTLKKIEELHECFLESLKTCLGDLHKRGRLKTAIQTLGSDDNFAAMGLYEPVEKYEETEDRETALCMFKKYVKKMSSGHAIVFITIVHLVASVAERTLVIIDEPESHLHPPLLSAFTRALSDLLYNRNAVAIIATHSPVVLQEVPKSCVNIITRSHTQSQVHKPEVETFAENVGILTREVFGLEVMKSGFHSLLKQEVDEGGTYDDILKKFHNAVGFEGRAILRSMIANREKLNEND